MVIFRIIIYVTNTNLEWYCMLILYFRPHKYYNSYIIDSIQNTIIYTCGPREYRKSEHTDCTVQKLTHTHTHTHTHKHTQTLFPSQTLSFSTKTTALKQIYRLKVSKDPQTQGVPSTPVVSPETQSYLTVMDTAMK